MTLELFTDGSTIQTNPSPRGGCWAWVLVRNGQVERKASGLIEPTDWGLEAITNNQMELFAALRGIESLPQGFKGRLWSDSAITLHRIMSSSKFNGCPDWLRDRVLEARNNREWHYDASLVAGHATDRELRMGRSEDGRKVSKWNSYVDLLCRRVARKWACNVGTKLV